MSEDLRPCPACDHPHVGYEAEPCVSCGCDATYLTSALRIGSEQWVGRLVRSWIRDPQFKELMDRLGDD